ncbi:hypothetical protein [Streptomyces sp. NPDC002265]|uniref:hypothetical protein n=1 Tax=Streptomyces sp. NPDC002265 TaxID=3154415 RepID=UPI00331AE7DC
MMWWQACLWGALGAGLVEAGEMWQLHRTQERFPWVKDGEPQIKPYLLAVFLRCFMAIGITAVYGVSGQVAGPLAAVTLGVAAPVIIQQIADSSPAGQPAVEPGATITERPGQIVGPDPQPPTQEPDVRQPPPPPNPGRSHDDQ